MDAYIAKLLSLPMLPLARWPLWPYWRTHRPEEAPKLAFLLATCLRESLEEMRLNPLSVRFLGPMPPQSLRLFQRSIYPMVGWVTWQRRFVPNWEVEKIVHFPLGDLLDPTHYARYKLNLGPTVEKRLLPSEEEFPCFVGRTPGGREILWGATFRIVAHFLELVFGFQMPDISKLPVVTGTLSESYLTGQG
ncbi:hypothetical protein ACFL0Q_05090 [Thermodesulfobacteriota bacterium]